MRARNYGEATVLPGDSVDCSPSTHNPIRWSDREKVQVLQHVEQEHEHFRAVTHTKLNCFQCRQRSDSPDEAGV